jgi:hypothetical protein
VNVWIERADGNPHEQHASHSQAKAEQIQLAQQVAQPDYHEQREDRILREFGTDASQHVPVRTKDSPPQIRPTPYG